VRHQYQITQLPYVFDTLMTCSDMHVPGTVVGFWKYFLTMSYKSQINLHITVPGLVENWAESKAKGVPRPRPPPVRDP